MTAPHYHDQEEVTYVLTCTGEPSCSCDDCRRLVYCFQPHWEVKDYYVIAENRKELKKRAARLDEVDGDQCGDCGGPIDEDGNAGPWILHMATRDDGVKRYWVECTCGNQVPVRVREARECIW
jgi:hypothetical protein